MAELASIDVPIAFGKYRLHRLLGQGGMGRVYLAGLAGEFGFEKRLVVKTILPELGDDPRFVDMFAAEAKTAVALSHGNIVPIYELGRWEGIYYIAMGYIDGPSLAEFLHEHARRRQPIPLATALFIAREVLTGMAYAHHGGPDRPPVVHRDLSPRNIVLDRSGQVRIVDFGIAISANMQSRGGVGSHGYVAPEQARAAPADPRADVFSVACLLYELVSGTRAYPTEGVWVPPDLNCLPAALRPVLARALSIDPAQRPADAGEFLDALVPSLTRDLAAYGDKELALHLRALFPAGWNESAASPHEHPAFPGTGHAVTPRTFATRFTVLTASAGAHPRGRHRWAQLAMIAGALALASGVVAAGRFAMRAPPPGVDSLGEPSPPTQPTPASIPPAPSPQTPDLAGQPVHLTVEPAGATLQLGERTFAGGSPYVVPSSSIGLEPAEIRHPGYVPERVDLRGATGPIRITLQPTPVGHGRLSVLTPALNWAEVQIDGGITRHTPLTDIELPAGRHHVVVRCVPEVCPTPRVVHDARVRVQPGQTTEVRVDAMP